MPGPRKPPSVADIVAGPNMLDTIKSLERMTAGPALLADRLMTTSKGLDTIAPTARMFDQASAATRMFDQASAATRMFDQASAATRMFDQATAVERASRIGERFGASLPEIPRPDLTEINKSLDHVANLRAAEKRREVERQQAMVNALHALRARADAAEAREIESRRQHDERERERDAREAASEARHEWRERWLVALTFIAALAAVIALLH